MKVLLVSYGDDIDAVVAVNDEQAPEVLKQLKAVDPSGLFKIRFLSTSTVEETLDYMKAEVKAAFEEN